jgi:hypothetical protein
MAHASATTEGLLLAALSAAQVHRWPPLLGATAGGWHRFMTRRAVVKQDHVALVPGLVAD